MDDDDDDDDDTTLLGRIHMKWTEETKIHTNVTPDI
jgi:hypothetical protein